MGFFQLCTIFVLLNLGSVSPQLCDDIREVITIRLVPTPYRGTTAIKPMPPCMDETNSFVCEAGNVLFDGNLGPVNPDITRTSDNEQFVGWNDKNLDAFISFEITAQFLTISAIDLYILNYPEQNSSVPNFQLYSTSNPHLLDPSEPGAHTAQQIEFDLLNNEQLSQDDTTVRKITLLFRTPFANQAVLLRWNFDGLHNVQWLVLSEIRLCGDTQPEFEPGFVEFHTPSPSVDEPVLIEPSAEILAGGPLMLTCTVSLQGSYRWRWKKGTVQTTLLAGTSILGADGTRTSVLVINGVDFDDAGVYSCEATFTKTLSFVRRRYDVQFPIRLQGVPSARGFVGEGSVTISCEIQGYASSSNSLVWSNSTGVVSTETSKYAISTDSGTNTLIYHNGTTGSSIVSSLTINELSFEDEGNYTCSIGGVTTVSQLTVITGTAPPTTVELIPTTATPTSTAGRNLIQGASNTTATVAGVVVTLIILSIAVTAVIILVLVFLHSRRRRRPSIVRRRKPSVTDSTHSTDLEMQQRLTKADIEWQIPQVQNGTANEVDVDPLYATITKVRKPSHSQNILETEASESHSTGPRSSEPEASPVTEANFYDEAKSVDPSASEGGAAPETNIYEEASLPRRRMTNSSAPKLAKLRTAGSNVVLDQNPIYESSVNLSSDSDKLIPQPEEVKPDVVYAQPMKRKPPASTKVAGDQEQIYSEALTPAMFKQPPPDLNVPLHPYGPIYAEPITSKKKKLDNVKVVEAANFIEHGLIGIGQFGEVVLAQTVNLSRSDLGLTPADNDQSVHLNVAIKKLGSDTENPVRENFDKEIVFMSRLKDKNIVQLLAIGTGSDPFIVMEYMEKGDLHQYLEDYDMAVIDSTVYQGQIPVSLLVNMSVQIASGMKYLSSHNYVHRDLATRNCLVSEDITVKIADFGMSRNMYARSYYKVRGRAMLPIRWMARECFYGSFSEKTDIWSFGVALWEIFTLGKSQPYEYLDDQEVIQEAVKEEARLLLERPEACPKSVYEVMLRCWENKAKDRAGFKEVYDSLNALHQTM